jgi:hypothetical protein
MVAEPMLAKLGTFDGTAFDGFNCDSWELGHPTWTPGFRRAFMARRGYDPIPYLPVLAGYEVGAAGRRFLFDLRTTVSDLIVETHYRRVSEWCRARGVAFEAQAGGPHRGPKDLLQAQGAVDIPMGEFWMHGRSYVKIASSAAHTYGKRLVGLESFTDTRAHHHFAISPAQMKPRADEAFLFGGNYLNLAVTEYSPAEAGLPGWVHNAGPHLNHCQTWWPLARPFFDYLARCCFLLQSGRDVAHVAVYHTFRAGKDGLWAEPGNPRSKWPKDFAFDYVNDDLVQNHMSVRDGRIVLTSGASYQILYIVPTPRSTMPLATLVKIRDLARRGATVVWAGKSPTQCPGLTDYPQCDAKLKTIVKDLWGSGRLIAIPKHELTRLVPLLEKSPNPPAWRRLSTRDTSGPGPGDVPSQGPRTRALDPGDRRDNGSALQKGEGRRTPHGPAPWPGFGLCRLSPGRRRATARAETGGQTASAHCHRWPLGSRIPPRLGRPSEGDVPDVEILDGEGRPWYPALQRHRHLPHDIHLPRCWDG